MLMYHSELFHNVENLKKRSYGGNKSHEYFFIGAKMRGVEVILQILRFGGNFCGDHGASAPPPSANCVSYIYLPSILGKLHTAKIFKRLIIDQIKVT